MAFQSYAPFLEEWFLVSTFCKKGTDAFRYLLQ